MRAVFIALALFMPIFAFVADAPAAEAHKNHTPNAPDLRIERNGFSVGIVARESQTFVDSTRPVVVWFNVTNQGNSTQHEVAYFAYAVRTNATTGLEEARIACALRTFPGPSLTPHHLTLTLNLPRPGFRPDASEAEIQEAQWKVYGFVNYYPKKQPDGTGIINEDAFTEQRCKTMGGDRVVAENLVDPLGNEVVVSPQTDRRRDNFASRFVIVDRKLNLTVADLKVCQKGATACEDPTAATEGGYYNTPEYGQSGRAFDFRFKVDARNSTWPHLQDPNCRRGTQFDCKWVFNVTLTGKNLNQTSRFSSVVRDNVTLDDLHMDLNVEWPLYQQGGVYNFTLALDSTEDIREAVEVDNVAKRELNVRAPDLRGLVQSTGLKTSAADPFTYTNGGLSFPVFMNIMNLGDFRAENATGSRIHWWLFLDEVSSDADHWLMDASNATVVSEGANFTVRYDFLGHDPASSNTQGVPIGPGRHTLILIVDPRASSGSSGCSDPDDEATCKSLGSVYEGNETNNRHELPIYVIDTRAPVVENFRMNWTDYRGVNLARTPDSSPSTVDARVNRSEVIRWDVDVTDDDDQFLDARLFVKDPSGNVTNATMKRWPGTPSRELHLNQSYLKAGAHTVWVEARDSAGNFGKSREFQLTVTDWAIQTKPASQIIRQGAKDNDTYNYTGDDKIKFVLGVYANDTGLLPEHREDNKLIRVQYPNNPAYLERRLSSDASSQCREPPPVPPIPGVPDPVNPGCTNSEVFSYLLVLDIVGRYNVTFAIVDKSGKERLINRTFELLGPVPQIENFSRIPDAPAGATLTNVTAYVSDTFGIRDVFVEFRHKATGYKQNYTMKRLNGTELLGNWTVNVSTGFDHNMDWKELANGGAYEVKFAAVNVNDAWGTAKTNFTLIDTLTPVLRNVTVTPTEQEIQLPVKFSAIGTDNANFSVQLTLRRGPSEVIEVVKMKREGLTNTYSYTRNFSTAGDYTYLIEAIDAAGLRSEPVSGTLPVRDNLPPRIRILEPAYVSASGERFSGANLRLSIFIEDRDGILEESINVSASTVNDATGALVPFALTDPVVEQSLNPRGLLVRVDGGSRLTHNTAIVLNVSATDTSLKELTGFLAPDASRLRIDDRPPVSQAPIVIGPQHRRLDTDPLNVSLDTQIRLTAKENEDPAHTEVRSIQFTVLRPGSALGPGVTSREFTINNGEGFTFRELFTKREVQDFGSGLYRIQYSATDAAGNKEQTPKHVDLILDALPPTPDPLATLPQGRHINATWIDPHPSSGVSRSVVWYRVNDGVYKAVEMRLGSGVWSGVIPEGVRGDTVCYYLQAWDGVENAATFRNATNPFCFPVGNQVPTLRLLEPGDGARVRGTLNVRWLASDPDGDSLTYKVFARLTGRQNAQELASLGAGSDRYALDTTKLADGSYELQVTVTDGNFIAFDKVTIIVQNAREPIACSPSCVGKSTLRPGESLLITAEVRKAGATVEARIFRDGALVQTVAMRDDGNAPDAAAGDNVYSAEARVTEGGTYTVEIYATYQEDGEQKTDSLPGAATFTVKLTAADVFSQYAALWVALVSLVVACAGVGGYALIRKWRT